MKNLKLNPMHYIFKSSTRDPNKVSKALNKYYPDMRIIGSAMGSLNVIPIMEDEKKPGKIRTSGNIGIKIKDLPGFFITGTEVNKVNLQKESVVYVEKVDYEKTTIYMTGSVKPSREVLIHDLIYKKFPEIKIVLHTHDNLILNYGKVPTTKFVSFAAALKDALESVELLEINSCINLKKHGQVIKGKHVEDILKVLSQNHESALKNFQKKFKLPVPL